MSDTPETRLWQAVLAQAVEDATASTVTMDPSFEDDRAEARDWLTGGSPEFIFACRAAGYEPEFVRDNAFKLSERDWVPRETAVLIHA